MSGLSEIDIRDFKDLDVRQARVNLDKTVGHSTLSVYQEAAHNELKAFLSHLEEIQRNTYKQIPSLFKPKE